MPTPKKPKKPANNANPAAAAAKPAAKPKNPAAKKAGAKKAAPKVIAANAAALNSDTIINTIIAHRRQLNTRMSAANMRQAPELKLGEGEPVQVQLTGNQIVLFRQRINNDRSIVPANKTIRDLVDGDTMKAVAELVGAVNSPRVTISWD